MGLEPTTDAWKAPMLPITLMARAEANKEVESLSNDYESFILPLN